MRKVMLRVTLMVFCLLNGTVEQLFFGPDALLGIQGAMAQIPSEGLVAYYPFNGNANDESGNGNHGTVNGATLTADRFGNFNGAYSFNGISQYIGLQGTQMIDFSDGISFSAWIKADELRMASIVDKEEYCSSQGYRINTRSNSEIWAEHSCYGSQISGANTAKASSSYSAGLWYHIVGTLSLSNGNSIYVNGQLIQNVPVGITVNNLKMIEIGKSTLDQGESFKGIIDNIAIYNRALFPSEIQQLYQDQTGQVQQPFTCNITAPTTTLCAGQSATLTMNTTGGVGASSQLPANLQQGLVAYYPFNGNANDESGNGNNGTVNGATLTADRFGNTGSAYSFNSSYLGHYSGNDYIRCLNPGPLGNSSRTVSFWVKTDSTSISQLNNIVFSYGSNETVSFQQFRVTLAGSCSQSISAVSFGANRDIPYVPSGDWEMVSVVFDSNVAANCAGIKLYFNSIELQNYCYDFAGSAINTSGLHPITLGCYHDLNWTTDRGFYKGLLDDVMVYNRALSPAEIQQLYTAQSYAWSTNATTPTITVAPTANTTYSCTITQGNQTCTASVDITVNPNITNTISATIIEGETYTLGAQTLTTAGSYTEVFTSANGCDSTVTLTLAVEPLLTCEITAPATSLCEGESVTLSVNTTGGAAASSQLPANLQQGLVAYYPFNGNANDESGNGNNGVVNGATLTADRYGNVGSAYSFDGVNDYVDVANSSTLNIFGSNSSNTISFWLNRNDLNNCDYISKGLHTPGCYLGNKYLAVGYSSNLGIYSNLYNSNLMSSVTATGNSGSIQTWVQVTIVRAETLLMYINGQLVSAVPNASGWNTDYNSSVQTNLKFGARNNIEADCNTYFSNFFYNGLMDDIAIYNRALSPSEIQQLYSAQSYAWSNNETTPIITVSPTENTTYSCTVTQGSQTCTASVDITVNPNVTNAISATIIEGEAYTLGTQTLTTAATYTEVFTSSTGCDSTVTLTLSVEPLLTCNITAPTTTLCEGETVTLSVNTTGGAGASSELPSNLQQGLVAYYPFNGNANDESGNGNDGSFTGYSCNVCGNQVTAAPMLVQDHNFNFNSAFEFNDQLDFISVPNSSSLQLSSFFSINIWIRPTTYNFSGFSEAVVFSKWGNVGDASYEIKILSNGKFKLNTHNSNVTTNMISSTSLSLNQWSLITVSFDNGNCKFYLNGQLDNSSTSLNVPMVVNNSLEIGRNFNQIPNYSNEGFIGTLDDVSLFNRALSPSEIQQLYTAQSYAWSNDETTPTITVSPTQTTTYTATVTTATQTCTDSITITVNPLLTWYADADADGFGSPDDVVQDCNQPQGYIADNSDCNDADASSYPNAEEICFDQIDNNCNGSTDENCAIFGCINPNACNFNPQANTDDGSCILPQPESCNGLDDNCNGQVDEGFSAAAINAVSAVTALYPICSGNSIRSANLNNGTNSAVIDGNGNDLWYSFTAQFNTFRAGLSAAFGDNDVRLYTMTPGGCLELIETEHENTAGNQTLLSDQLTVGQTYYVAVHNISGPMNASAKICFNHLNASTCDHYYSNNTGIYNSVCNSFKAQYRANAVAYTFDILSATQNNVNQNITPWSYTTTSASTVVPRLGTLLPANQGTSAIVYTLKVPVLYSLFDAAGNFENLFAQATTTCTVTLNAEQTVALRISDRCPTNKSLTSTIAPDRTVCGAMRYDWEFTQVLPTAGTAQVVQGGNYTTVFFLSNVPGIGAGKTYNVRVRPVHSSGITGNWGAVQCLRVGSAGMVQQSESESDWSKESRVSGVSIYPNPTATGSFVLQYNAARRGELIFAQEPTTSESNFAQESMTELVMMDITGKVVFKTNVVLNGNMAEIHFGDLESGLYLVDFGGERSRVQVMK